MSEFQPELGQAIFGQPHKQYAVPEIMIAVLSSISDEYDRVYWNVKQKRCYGPFGNNGCKLITPVFQVHAYSWGDDDQPFNFAWRDLEISWYKWMGRGASANMEISPQLAAECLTECIEQIRRMDEETDSGAHPYFIDLE